MNFKWNSPGMLPCAAVTSVDLTPGGTGGNFSCNSNPGSVGHCADILLKNSSC